VKKALALVALFLWTAPLWGQIDLPAEIKARPGRLFRVEAKVPANAVVVWDAGGADIDFIPFPPPYTHIAVCVAPKPGRYRVVAIAAPAANKPAVAATILLVGDAPPDPWPNPPDPPTPPPAPGGVRVLVVYETAELAKMSDAQRLVLFSVRVRDYLNQKCAQDGKVKAWRIWDKDTDVSAESKEWKEAMARPRKSAPWLFINGKTVYDGPLPTDVEETLALLKKHLE
jgi:hypothetical protein